MNRRYLDKIPDALSYFRLLSIPFFLVLAYLELRTSATILFALAGFSDFLDGKIARRLGVASIRGADLDSICDQLWIFATIPALYFLTPDLLYFIRWPTAIVMGYFILLRLYVAVTRGRIASLHLWSGKAAVFFFFLMVLSFFVLDRITLIVHIFFIMTFTDVIEETLIMLLFDDVHPDTSSLYHLLKTRRSDK